METPPPLTQLPFKFPDDLDQAEVMAKHLGYRQYAYTSTSDLWGLFCLPENPANQTRGHTRPHLPPFRPGVIIKTKELGLLFVQDWEDVGLGS